MARIVGTTDISKFRAPYKYGLQPWAGFGAVTPTLKPIPKETSDKIVQDLKWRERVPHAAAGGTVSGVIAGPGTSLVDNIGSWLAGQKSAGRKVLIAPTDPVAFLQGDVTKVFFYLDQLSLPDGVALQLDDSSLPSYAPIVKPAVIGGVVVAAAAAYMHYGRRR